MIKSASLAALAIAVVSLVPAVAAADPGGITAGGRVELMPVGSFKFAFGGQSDTEDAAVAYGIAAQVEYNVSETIAVGVSPRYILNVIPEGEEGDAGTELDLMLRAQYNHLINPRLGAFGFLTMGYSIIMLPGNDDDPNPAGFALGLGGGVRNLIGDKLFVQGELGYQVGFQSISEGDDSFTLSTSFLHIGVGVGSHF